LTCTSERCKSAGVQSPTYRLADILLGGKLADYVHEARAAGRSWRRIAIDLRDVTKTEIDVTHETLRSWFPDEPDDDANGGEGAAA
jgi:hypothetical protein